MRIHIPKELTENELAELGGDLRFFFDAMVRKLHINRHKGFTQGKSLGDLKQALMNETRECYAALDNESQFDVVLECADVANQAFLLALGTLHMDKQTFTEARKNL